MTSPRDVEVDILARDKTAKATRMAAANFRRLKRDTDESSSSYDRLQKRFASLAKTAAGAAKSVGKVTAAVAAAVSVVGPLTTGMLGAAKATVAFAKASARTAATLAPLAAFLPGLVGSAGLLVGTLRLAGPGLVRALAPVTQAFVDADGNAGKITKRLQTLIAVGVEPLAKQFAKVNLPIVAAGMDRITIATNAVVRSFGSWVNSFEGQSLIRDVVDATASAAERLAPRVTAAAIAVGRLAGKAGDRAITGFADLVGRILDKFTAWAESTSVADINRSLRDLSGWGTVLREKFEAVREIGRWMAENVDKVKAFSNALASVGIVVGLLTGGWVAVVIGALSLLINNFDAVKGAAERLSAPLRRLWNLFAGDAEVQAAIRQIKTDVKAFFDGFRQGTADVGPKFERAIRSIKAAWDQWAPAVLGFLAVLKPALQATGLILGTTFGFAIDLISAVALSVAALGVAFKAFVRDSLKFLGFFVDGAAAAFGWVPGLGPKLQAAALAFDLFATKVNRSLDGIRDQTITLNVVAKTSTTTVNGKRVGVGEGGTVPRVGAFGGLSSWRPAQVAAALFGVGAQFAMAGGGTSRVGGPTEVTSNIDVAVNLDGQPFRAMTARAVSASERRQAWRAKVGRR